MNQDARFATRVILAGIFFLFVVLVGPQAANAGSTLTVNTNRDDSNPDSFLTFREAIMLASGYLNRPLTEYERNQVSGGCFIPSSPTIGGVEFWVASPPNASNGCPNIGKDSSDNIVFAPDVDVINFLPQNFPSPSTVYLDVGCNDHINGDRGGGQKVTLNGNGTTYTAALWLSPISCPRGVNTSNHIRNLIIRGFAQDALVGQGVTNGVFEGLEIFQNGQNGINLFVFTHEDGTKIGPTGNTVGGPDTSQRNFIHSNGANGISLSGHPSNSSPSNNHLLNNFIGISRASSTEANGNRGHGISITDLRDTTIGSEKSREGNTIVGNEGDGIRIVGRNSDRNFIIGNSIGVNGATRLGNRRSGISLADGARRTGISNNIIGDNRTGVTVAGPDTEGNSMSRNFIGTNPEGYEIGNATDGVNITGGSSNNIVGSSLQNEASGGVGNTIAFNGNDGVQITEGKENVILSNSIFSNRGEGIDLQPEGVTANDQGDMDDGPNELQNAPVIRTVNIVSSGTDYIVSIVWDFNSLPERRYRVQFFGNTECDANRAGEGRELLGSASVSTDGSGNLTSTSAFVVKRLPNSISSTATSENRANTSEFSNCLAIGQGGGGGGGGGTGPVIGGPGRIVRDNNVIIVRPPIETLSRADLKISIDATPIVGLDGIRISYNITVTNIGPSEARDVVVSDNLPDPLAFESCVSIGECGGGGNNRTVRFGILQANASATITIVARVRTIAPGMQVSNTVYVNAQTPDPNPNNNTATATSTAPRLSF